MKWRAWKLGVVIAVAMSLLVAGSGLVHGMDWQAFLAVFCTACLTHLGTFLKDHPPDQISFDTETITKTTPGGPPPPK